MVAGSSPARPTFSLPHWADCHDRWQGLGRGCFGPVSGEPLHTAAHEAAHVVQQLGGQEGEPVMNTNLPDYLIVEGESLQSSTLQG